MPEKFYRKVLKNGMTVIFEKRKGGVVSVAFAVRAGSINEKEEEKGISHFIEHIFYKGTPKRTSKQISAEIEKKGGVLNGFTSEQVTAYWCKMPSKHIMTALDVLGDMVRNPLFNEKEIEKERNVIFEEMKLYRDNPHLHVHDKIQSFLYKGTLGMSTIGTEKTLANMGREVLVRKFKELYSTNNLILCVVGDTDFKKICDFAEKNFPKSKSKIPQRKIILSNGQGIEKRKGIDQANLVLSYHVPKATDKGYHDAQVLNAVLAGGMSSRLFQEIREKRNLAYAVKGGCNIDKDFGFNSIYVGTSKENVSKVKKLVLEEFKKLKHLTKDEFEEIKEQLIGNDKISREDSQGEMLELLGHEIIGRVSGAFEYEKMIREVKLEDVKKLAAKVPGNYSFFVLEPE